MRRSRIAPDSKNRLRAVFLCRTMVISSLLTLGGCSLQGDNPVVSTFAGLLPGHGSVSAAAKRIPYASIDFTIGRRGGLLVLAEQTPNLTFWSSSQHETIVFRDGYLQSTSGLDVDLQMTQVYGDDAGDGVVPWRKAYTGPLHYSVLRSWTTADGEQHADRAAAEFDCGAKPETIDLPLTRLALQRCVETLNWDRGGKTKSVIWRDSDKHEVWAVDSVPWPGGPHISWKVARPWWR